MKCAKFLKCTVKQDKKLPRATDLWRRVCLKLLKEFPKTKKLRKYSGPHLEIEVGYRVSVHITLKSSNVHTFYKGVTQLLLNLVALVFTCLVFQKINRNLSEEDKKSYRDFKILNAWHPTESNQACEEKELRGGKKKG